MESFSSSYHSYDILSLAIGSKLALSLHMLRQTENLQSLEAALLNR